MIDSAEPNTSEALALARRWRTTPVQGVAIHVDPVTHEKGKVEARCFDEADLDEGGAADQWLRERWGKANCYLSVNELKTPLDKRAGKVDIGRVDKLAIDADVPEGVDQEAGAQGIADAMAEYPLQPTDCGFSGGGWQGLWGMEADPRLHIDGDEAKAAVIERVGKALREDVQRHLASRGVPAKLDSVENVDRIMRWIGTPNVPDETKIAKGRKPAMSRRIETTGDRYTLDTFAALATSTESPGPTAKAQDVTWDQAKVQELAVLYAKELPDGLPPKAQMILEDNSGGPLDEPDELRGKLEAAGLLGNAKLAHWSHVMHALNCALLSSGHFSVEQVVALAACDRPCNRHGTWRKIKCLHDSKKVLRQIRDSIAKSYDERPIALAADGWPGGVNEETNLPNNNYANAKAAVGKLRIECWHDEFRQQGFIGGLDLTTLNGKNLDRAVSRMRDRISERFGFYPQKEVMWEAVTNLCAENSRNPVLDYFAGLKWDGVQRLDKMLHKYLGAEDTPLNSAYSRKFMCAIVRRAKKPGCKWDYQLTLQGKQGIRKSTFCEDLAVESDLYTDAGEVGATIKESMEVMTGKQVIEIPELAGLGKSDRNKNKAHLSRKVDRARKAYDRHATEAPRSSVSVGTINEGCYLDDPTGERRFWHVAVRAYGQEPFLRDKYQLYAEAVALEPNENLWLDTQELEHAHDAVTQTAKVPNALVDLLSDLHGKQFGNEERVSSADVRKHLQMTNADIVRIHSLGGRIQEAMMSLGWSNNKTLVLQRGRQPERGYSRPLPPTEKPTLPLQLQGGDDAVPF